MANRQIKHPQSHHPNNNCCFGCIPFFFLNKSFFGPTKENFGGFGINIGAPDIVWENQHASDYVDILALKYGQPSSLDQTVGGIAIWKRDRLMNTCLDRIEVKDEAIPHCHPTNHLDFVYGYVNYDVSPSKFVEVTSLSGTIGYDALKKQLWARCGTIESVIATLALATQVGEGDISLNYAQANELLPHYLMSTKDPERISRLYNLLCYNLRHQSGDPSPGGSWPLASPMGCTGPLPDGMECN